MAPKAFLAERAAPWRPCCPGSGVSRRFQEGPGPRLRLTALRGSLLWNCLHREPRARLEVSGWPTAGCSTALSSSCSWSWRDLRRTETPTPGHREAICLAKSLFCPLDLEKGEERQVSKASPTPRLHRVPGYSGRDGMEAHGVGWMAQAGGVDTWQLWQSEAGCFLEGGPRGPAEGRGPTRPVSISCRPLPQASNTAGFSSQPLFRFLPQGGRQSQGRPSRASALGQGTISGSFTNTLTQRAPARTPRLTRHPNFHLAIPTRPHAVPILTRVPFSHRPSFPPTPWSLQNRSPTTTRTHLTAPNVDQTPSTAAPRPPWPI